MFKQHGVLSGRVGYLPDNGWKPYYVIEAAIPLAMIGLATQNGDVYYALSWTQNCGNDAVRLRGMIDPGQQQVPAPGALAVMLLGLAGAGRLSPENSAPIVSLFSLNGKYTKSGPGDRSWFYWFQDGHLLLSRSLHLSARVPHVPPVYPDMLLILF